MLVIFGLILVALIAIVGGDRGVMSLIALAGNLLILCIAIWLIASGVPVFPVTICLSVVICCITLFYQNGINAICVYGSAYYNIHFVFCNWH